MLTEKSSRKVLLSCPFSQYRSSGGSPARAKPVHIPTVPLPSTTDQNSSISSRGFQPEASIEQYLLEKKACVEEESSSMSISMTDLAGGEEDFLQSEKGCHHLNLYSINKDGQRETWTLNISLSIVH